MRTRYNNFYRIFFAFCDLFALSTVQLILLHYFKVTGVGEPDFYIISYLYKIMVWLICSYITSVYINNDFTDFFSNFKRSVSAFAGFIFFVFETVMY